MFQGLVQQLATTRSDIRWARISFCDRPTGPHQRGERDAPVAQNCAQSSRCVLARSRRCQHSTCPHRAWQTCPQAQRAKEPVTQHQVLTT